MSSSLATVEAISNWYSRWAVDSASRLMSISFQATVASGADR